MRRATPRKHSFVRHALASMLLKQVIDRPAQEMLQCDIELHSEDTQLFAHRHFDVNRQLHPAHAHFSSAVTIDWPPT